MYINSCTCTSFTILTNGIREPEATQFIHKKLYQHKNDEKCENIERTVREKSNPTPK